MSTTGRAACVHCGAQMITLNRRLYCGDACRQAAHRARRSIDARVWDGTAIQRRCGDGYVNATAMCQANHREWSTYARSERTKAYLNALQSVLQNCRTELVQSISGGRPDLQGTWIHPRLAVDLARWISPEFAVWMDGWFLEAAAQPSKPRQPRQARVIAAAPAPLSPAIGYAERRLAIWAEVHLEQFAADGDIEQLMAAERVTQLLNHRINAKLVAAGHCRTWR